MSPASPPPDARCPVCEEPAPRDGALRCECGYDFAARDPSAALVRLGYARRRARWLLRRGAGTGAAAAVLLLLVHGRLADHVELVTLIFAQLALGTWWAARGVLDARLARRRLRAASAIGQLPAARVVHGLR
jgi:hypothetical protein